MSISTHAAAPADKPDDISGNSKKKRYDGDEFEKQIKEAAVDYDSLNAGLELLLGNSSGVTTGSGGDVANQETKADQAKESQKLDSMLQKLLLSGDMGEATKRGL